MKDLAEVRWLELFAVWVATVVMLVVVSQIRGDELASTAFVGVPLGGVLVALVLAYAKRAHR